MHQRIQRVPTRQGEVAVASLGAGRPLLYVDGWLSHLETSWEMPDLRAYFEELSDGCRFVRYDRVGCGLSDPLTTRPSISSELDQITAIAEHLGAPIDLMGTSLGAPIAAAWAAQHPDAVRRLVLYGGWARGEDIAPASAREHIVGLVAQHWGLGADVLTEIFAPDASARTRAAIGRYQRASSDPTTAAEFLAMSYALDVTPALPQVSAPTLVIHRREDRAAPLAQAVAVSRAIPGARLVELPGRSHLPYAGDVHALVTVVRRFLGLPVRRRGPATLTPRQLEVAGLVAEGLTNREIGLRLGIAERSAEGHVERIREHLGLRSRAQVAAWYSERGAAPEVG